MPGPLEGVVVVALEDDPEARRSGLLTGIPVLAVTALTMTPQEVRDAGFDGYLQKPVDPFALSETVRALARRRAPRSRSAGRPNGGRARPRPLE
jgi:DNA-binding response OmpR family regulator